MNTNTIEEKLDAYLESQVSEILADPALQNLTPEQKEEYTTNLRTHFQDLVIDTLLNHLEDDKLKEIEELSKNNPQLLEEKFQDYAAMVPGLTEDIEDRLKRETVALKQNLQLPQI